ncbi:MAG: PhnD/SsuA/transferrin family substrate-binding protein [Thermoanaerobaculia bacterium]|nr:PhnD/SsuA/transferrin family substrate-binding protein [Thermoanaerobaculia bacterium]
MTAPSSGRFRSPWIPRAGWTLVVLGLAVFVWGMNRRADLAASDEGVVRMLFVPSVEQGTLAQRGDELARFIREDTGLILQTEVPTSYAAVIQALGSDQADVAWMPAFAYVIANQRYGAQARLQVVRSVDRFAIVVTRKGAGQPETMNDLRARRVAVPSSLEPELRERIVAALDREAEGWIAVDAENDLAAVRQLVERPLEVDAAVSSYVFSGPYDFVGDGRKELEYHRPGTLLDTRILFTTDTPVGERAQVYYGSVFSRVDSGARRLDEFAGRSFAFSDETSTSGHIFPRMLLNEHGVELSRVYFAGGHPNVIQAVWDGKAVGGAAFYSPPGETQAREGTLVGDARMLLLSRMPDIETRRAFLDEVRIVALSNPIPNDLCAARAGFSEDLWQRFERSFRRFISTPAGQEAYFDLVAGVDAASVDDSYFDGFRHALDSSGMSADSLLEAAEKKLESRRKPKEDDPKEKE